MARQPNPQEKDPRMDGAAFARALKRLELGERAAANFFQVNLSTVQDWLSVGPSGPADKLTRLLLAWGATAPAVDRYLESHRQQQVDAEVSE